MLENIRSTFRSRKQHHRTASSIPYIRYDNVEPRDIAPTPFSRSRSFRNMLPNIPRLKPITISNFAAVTKPEESPTPSANEVGLGEDLSTRLTTPACQTPASQSFELLRTPIKRKPVPTPGSFHIFNVSDAPKFDPQAPRRDPTMHVKARAALMKRYQSKFKLDFEPVGGTNVRDYDFLWVQHGELERRVMEDIIWVRERFAYARKEEPGDDDIIWWFDAENFAEEGYGSKSLCQVEEG